MHNILTPPGKYTRNPNSLFYLLGTRTARSIIASWETNEMQQPALPPLQRRCVEAAAFAIGTTGALRQTARETSAAVSFLLVERRDAWFAFKVALYNDSVATRTDAGLQATRASAGAARKALDLVAGGATAASAASDAARMQQEGNDWSSRSWSVRLDELSSPTTLITGLVTVSAREALDLATLAVCAALKVYRQAETALAAGNNVARLMLHAAKAADAAANASEDLTPNPAAVAAVTASPDPSSPHADLQLRGGRLDFFEGELEDQLDDDSSFEAQGQAEAEARRAVRDIQERMYNQCTDANGITDVTLCEWALFRLIEGVNQNMKEYPDPDPTDGPAVLCALHAARLLLEEEMGGGYWRCMLGLLTEGNGGEGESFAAIQEELKARALANAPPPQPAAPPVAAPPPQPAALPSVAAPPPLPVALPVTGPPPLPTPSPTPSTKPSSEENPPRASGDWTDENRGISMEVIAIAFSAAPHISSDDSAPNPRLEGAPHHT
jgi:outer membrane biosynthesis protein TonB